MNGLTDFIQGIVRSVIRLLLVMAAAVFLISLLLVAVVVMLSVSLWSLVTGRRPDLVKVFSQARQSSARFSVGGWSGGPRGGHAGKPDAVVVDVQAHEVSDKPGSGAKGRPGPSGGDEPMARVLH